MRKINVVVTAIFLISLAYATAQAQLRIAQAGTDNPTLMYQDEPVFKVGPLPEVALFAVRWRSDYLPQHQWLKWMQQHQLGYGRVYAESGYPWVPSDADRRIFPFEVVAWKEGKPQVDLTRFNQTYWKNFGKVIRKCRQKGIVLQLQLYQRVFFADKNRPGRWGDNYFNPANNINRWEVPSGKGGYGLLKAMAENTVWKDMHVQWVRHILDAVGDNGNVIIDLMNEGAAYAVSQKWIEFTLDIIEEWEQQTGNDILVGMDFDHFYKKKDDNLEYILSHPRLDVIICEGSEAHVVPELVVGDRTPKDHSLAVEFRQRYRKPVISTNSPSLNFFENREALHLYQWYALMAKVQGVGVYAKQYQVTLSDEKVMRYAEDAAILMHFFDNLRDYAALRLASEKIEQAPGKYLLALSSPREFVAYLHRGGEETSSVEPLLMLRDLEIADGPVRLHFFDPATGEKSEINASVKNHCLTVALPDYGDDLAVHIIPNE